jgi:ABC-type multidrug transport system fused ATPase/permease subunit
MGLSYRDISIFILISLATTVTEIFGISMFLPIFQFIRLDGNLDALINESTLWQYIVDTLFVLNIELSILPLLFLTFSLFIMRQVLIFISMLYGAAIKQRITQVQRDKLFGRYIDAYTSYHDINQVGGLVNLMTNEINGAVRGVLIPLSLVGSILMLFGYTFTLLILSWEMTLLSSVVLLVASKAPSFWIKKSAIMGRRIVNANTLMTEFIIDRLKSPRLVRLSGTEKAEKNEFHKLVKSQRKIFILGSILRAKTEVFVEPVVIGLSLVFLYLSYARFHLHMEVIGIYLLIALRLLPIVKGSLMQLQTIKRFAGSIELIEDTLKTMQEHREHDDGKKNLNSFKQSVLFRSVSYQYPNAKDKALKNITIEFKKGELTAIVGPSGSGKSTLIDLLPMLRHPTKGLVQIDGVNIKKYTLKSLRQSISYAPQFPQIFDGTVKNHILYGKVDATNDEVQEAIYLSGSENFINNLPQGINTVLSGCACNLSGGERQRLDLARALVRKSPILILDEPTSSLDAEAEEKFKSSLYKIINNTNTTIVIISHKLASISDADNIVVLNQGIIESCGTHLELLNQGGWYSKAWNMQLYK